MNIKDIIKPLVEICSLYYVRYYLTFNKELMNVNDDAKAFLAEKIYRRYVYETKTEEVYDVDILDFPYNKNYTLNNDSESLDVSTINEMINDFFSRPDILSRGATTSINVISLSDHPLDNFVCFNDKWIKWALDFYKY